MKNISTNLKLSNNLQTFLEMIFERAKRGISLCLLDSYAPDPERDSSLRSE
jgi:hypothetical protein